MLSDAKIPPAVEIMFSSPDLKEIPRDPQAQQKFTDVVITISRYKDLLPNNRELKSIRKK